jgi:Flp pilus assembly protein TadD
MFGVELRDYRCISTEICSGIRALDLCILLQAYSILLSALQRHDEAIAEIERAIDLEPLTPSLYMVQSETYYLAGRNDQALRALDRPPVLQENDAVARYNSARIYLRKGECAEAISRIRAVVDSQPGDAKALALLGYAYTLAGKKQEALAALDKLRDLSKVEYIEPGWMAMIWVGLGDKDKALTLLDQDYRLHSSFLMSIGSDPAFEPLHADGRFQDLLHRVGLIPK